MKKTSVLFLAAVLTCALLLSGCTAKQDNHGGNVNDEVTDSPLESIIPSDVLPSDGGHMDDDRTDGNRADDGMRPDVSGEVSPGAVTPEVSDDPLASPSPSTNPSGSAAPSAAESP